MQTELKNLIDAAMPRLLAIDDSVASSKSSPDVWSAKEILGHLIASAQHNHKRFVEMVFVDGLDFLGYNQNDWVELEGWNERPWAEILTFWHSYNLHLSWLLARIPDDFASRTCMVPWDVRQWTLAELSNDYCIHLEQHLEQLWERTK